MDFNALEQLLETVNEKGNLNIKTDSSTAITQQANNEEKPANVESSVLNNSSNNELVLRNAPNTEYFTQCHNNVFHVQATDYLLKVGLYAFIDRLQIGYDEMTKEIIIPFPYDKSKYQSIKLNGSRAVDERAAAKVLQHYNLQPYKSAEWNLHKGSNGETIDGGNTANNPFKTDSLTATLEA